MKAAFRWGISYKFFKALRRYSCISKKHFLSAIPRTHYIYIHTYTTGIRPRCHFHASTKSSLSTSIELSQSDIIRFTIPGRIPCNTREDYLFSDTGERRRDRYETCSLQPLSLSLSEKSNGRHVRECFIVVRIIHRLKKEYF